MPDSLRSACALGNHPGCEQEAFVHYALHRLYIQREEGIQAQTEKERVLQTYPNSRYARLLRGEK